MSLSLPEHHAIIVSPAVESPLVTDFPDPLLNQLIEGRYRIDELIATGGMSSVYQATDTRLDRTVAVKVMNSMLADDAGFVNRFQREAKAAARLLDPHVVSVFDQGTSDGLVFLVMEYVPGMNLRTFMHNHGALAPAPALNITEQVLGALTAAHRAGFVHRDIKPENVLLTASGTAKVADFGLARAIASTADNRTQGVIIGTVGYLSPEQVSAGEADERSDVYATGIMLFEMLTGAMPFDAPTPLAVAYKHVHDRVPAPSTINPDVPAAIDAIVLKATDRDPNKRYANAQEFADAVTAELAHYDTADRQITLPVVVAHEGDQPASSPHDETSALTSGSGTAVLPLDETSDTDQVAPDAADTDSTADTAPVPVTVSKATELTTAASGDIITNDGVVIVAADAPIPARRFRQRFPRWVILTGVLLLALVVAGGAWALGTLKYVPTPNLVGQTVAQAEATVQPLELRVEVGEEVFSEEVPKDIIVSSSPAEGVNARVGSAIKVSVSKGPERYPVPDVRGKSIEAATQEITDTKLAVSSSESVFDDTVPDGQVASTNPPAGTPMKPGGEVILQVSKGPAPVAVPNVAGVGRDQAIATLQQAGLVVSTTEEYNDGVAAGVAIGTAPVAGTQVRRGDPISLVISKGPPPVTVPSVRDMRSAEATAALQAAGLQVVKRNLTGFVALDRVVDQTPAGGSTVPKGTTVTITII